MTAWTDPPAASPPGRARRQGTRNSAGRAHRRAGRARPHCRPWRGPRLGQSSHPPQPAKCRRLAKGTLALYPPCRARGDPPPARGPRCPGPSATRPMRGTPSNHHPPAPTVTSTGRGASRPANLPASRPPARKSTRRTASGRKRNGHKPEQYGGHTLHDLSDANEARFGARPRMQRDRLRQSDAPPPVPRGPKNDTPEGGRDTDLPPPTPPALDRAGRTGPPTGGRTTQSQARVERDRAPPPPPELARWRTGLGQEARRGLSRMEGPYRRPAPEGREVRAPH